ncbi:hypothetical protein BZM27_06115 [Paraburkholderia steynii]|uniref:Uncharacterized protein n=1 Tax=Paraburkholderia steynii TaxID=1245441 RepID=A0A4R0XJ54_9BURK|nr:hypothetical protein BZM27_06115 [Paraburkholderia steynii]
MVQNYALVASGVVANTIIWDGDTENWQPPDGQVVVLIPSDAGPVSIGWKCDGSAFTLPEL